MMCTCRVLRINARRRLAGEAGCSLGGGAQNVLDVVEVETRH